MQTEIKESGVPASPALLAGLNASVLAEAQGIRFVPENGLVPRA
jgi:hypothetical protein